MFIIATLLFLITVLAPVAFWLWFFIWQDRSEPEPKRLLIKLFFLGIGVNIFAIAVEGTIFSILLPAQFGEILKGGTIQTITTFSAAIAVLFFLAGIIEELLKGFALWGFIYHKIDFNQIADGVFYAITLALGFSLVENILYFYQLYSTTTTIFVFGSLVRGIATTLLHITASGIVGYGLGKMKFTVGHRRSIILKSLILAMLLHGFFNFLVLLPGGIIIAFPLIFFVFIYLIKILTKPETRLVWKLVKPQKNLE
jgi:RsiW-degrading membrane proteinase PrsW (M82 family)